MTPTPADILLADLYALSPLTVAAARERGVLGRLLFAAVMRRGRVAGPRGEEVQLAA